MPTWKTHIQIAKKCNEFLKYNDNDYMLFVFGNILPDINNQYIIEDIENKVARDVTHFKYKDIPIHINFLNKYKDKINNPIIFGYYCHLFTDYSFNDFAYTKFSNEGLLDTMTDEEIRILKQGDFLRYSNNFNNNICITDIKLLLNKTKDIEEINITANDVDKIIKYLDIKDTDTNLNYFNKTELDNVLLDIVEKIKNFYLNK